MSEEDEKVKVQLIKDSVAKFEGHWQQREHIDYLLSLLSEKEEKKPLPKDIMDQWDTWREYISHGGTASWPRDAFENLIGWYEGEIKNLTTERDSTFRDMEKYAQENFKAEEKIEELEKKIEELENKE